MNDDYLGTFRVTVLSRLYSAARGKLSELQRIIYLHLMKTPMFIPTHSILELTPQYVLHPSSDHFLVENTE